MKNRISSVFILFLLLFTNSCMDLDKEPLDMISSDAVFKDEALSEAYLYKIYGYMPCGYGLFVEAGANVLSGMGITDLLDGSTDLLRSPAGWNESNGVMIPGTMSSTYNPLETWGRSYEAIRKVNNLIAGLSDDSPLSESFKERVIAEARFVRAFLYFDLVRRYGDVPLIKELQNFDNLQALLVPRTPKSDVYDFVETELEQIGEILPYAREIPATEHGRASREAAWALNGRVLLFAERYERSAFFSKKVIDEKYFELDDDYNALCSSQEVEIRKLYSK